MIICSPMNAVGGPNIGVLTLTVAQKLGRHPPGARRLLLLSCSQRKLDTSGKIPALQRYDGPAFQVVRRYLRETNDPLLHVCVLSAEYGIIAADDRIADYDRTMDTERAAALRESTLDKLKAVLRQHT